MRRSALVILVLTTILAPAASRANGVVGSFEVDGNRADDTGAGEPIDWATPPPGVGAFVDMPSGTGDDSFGLGSKHQDPGQWSCGDGGIPGKSDLTAGELAFRLVGADQFVYVDWQRRETNGSAHIDYEFNQSDTPNPACPELPLRTDGDIVISFDFGGSSSSIRAFSWRFTAPGAGVFDPLPVGSEHTTFDAAVNIPPSLIDPGADPGSFGEASLNLTDTIGEIDCGEFASVNLKTRSSEEINSALKDRTAAQPLPILCRLELEKSASGDTVAEGGSLTYTLTASNTGQGRVPSATITDELPAGTTFSSCTGGCTHSNGTATWTVGPLSPGDSVSVTVTVDVLGLPEGCLLCNTATVSSPVVNDGAPVESNEACVRVVPSPPNPVGANAAGSATGLHLDEGLLGIDERIGESSSAQSGVGSSSDGDVVQQPRVPPPSGSVAAADLFTTSSASAVTADPPAASQTSTAETLNVNLLGGAVRAAAVRGVATATADGTSASFNSDGSSFKGLVVNGVALNDVSPNTRVDLPAAVFGAGSYVTLYEKIGAVTTPPGLNGGIFQADLTVNMIRVHVTGALGVEAIDLVVSEAIAHADFPQVGVCTLSPRRAVSGHAFISSVTTSTPAGPVVVGEASIPSTGGHAHQDLDELDQERVTVDTAVTDSTGTVGSAATATSYAQAEGVCLLPSAGGCTVSAQAVRSEANSAADSTGASSNDGGTKLLGLAVMGTPLTAEPDPNTTITIPGVGFLVLNEQICEFGELETGCTDGEGRTGLTVRAIRLVVTGSIPAGAEIIVAEAHSDASYLS